MLYPDAPITPKALKMTMSTLSHVPIDFLSCSLIWIYNVQSPMVIPSMILLNTFFPILTIILRLDEHTSELQSRQYLVCRLLLEKKKKKQNKNSYINIIINIYIKDLDTI